MFARVSTYRGDGDRLLQGFADVSEPLEAIDGFSHAYFMVDRESGKGMSITIWKTEEALQASVEKADELRQRGAAAGIPLAISFPIVSMSGSKPYAAV